MDITTTEIMQLSVLALLAGAIGGVVGLVTLPVGRFGSSAAIVLAPLIACSTLCGVVFAMTLFAPHPNGVDPLTHALASTVLLGVGIFVFGSIPAAVGAALVRGLGCVLGDCRAQFQAMNEQEITERTE